MSTSTGCKKGIKQGFYQMVCGNKYSGKQFICKDCKEKEVPKSAGLTLTNDECVVLVASYIELESTSQLTDKESALYNKLKEHLGKSN